MLFAVATPRRPGLRLVSRDWNEATDEALMLAYKDGETAAFDVIVNRYRRPLLTFITRMTRNREMAEETLMEVFLKLHRSADRYVPTARFRTFLYTIAYRQALTEIGRKGNRLKTVSPEWQSEDGPQLREHADTRSMSAERKTIVDEQVRRLNAELANLPEAHRAAFALYYGRGLTCAECAEILEVSSAEVKGRLAYARRLLRERIPDI